jgi:NAD(P)-dependent dehydrogenase (short-subunit alcohol dehydrogenase family)
MLTLRLESHAAGRQPHVLFTGVGGSIGTAIASRVRQAGAKIFALSHVPAEGATVVDFSDDDALCAAVGALGDLDNIVLSHGLLEHGPWREVPPKAWRNMLDVNLNSIYAILFAAVPKMRRGGSIVVISSTAALDHSPVGGPHYTAGKWGVNGLVRHLADELGPSGIRINSIMPGLVDNPMGRAFLTEAEYFTALQDIPLRRAAEPDEIAKVAMFLLSDAASYVTGANLPVSGGYR